MEYFLLHFLQFLSLHCSQVVAAILYPSLHLLHLPQFWVHSTQFLSQHFLHPFSSSLYPSSHCWHYSALLGQKTQFLSLQARASPMIANNRMLLQLIIDLYLIINYISNFFPIFSSLIPLSLCHTICSSIQYLGKCRRWLQALIFKQIIMLRSADWQSAKAHANALKPGYPRSQSSAPRNNELSSGFNAQIPMCENTKQLYILGPGFPLYFIFLKYSIIMIFLLAISYSTLTIFWAYDNNSTFCLQNQPRIGRNGKLIECTSWMILLSRLDQTVSKEETVLRITSFVTLLFFLLYIREELRKYNSHFHERADPKISDYSIMIKSIPKQSSIKAKVRQLFQLAYPDKYKIVHIYPIGLLEQRVNYLKKIQELHKRYLTLNASGKGSNSQLIEIESEMDRLLAENKETNLRFKEQIDHDQIVCEKVVVTVNTEKAKEEILETQITKELMISIFGTGGQRIQFIQAPQPDEIIWENINIPQSIKIRRIIFGWSLFIILLGAVTIIFYFLLLIKVNEIQKALAIYKDDPVGSEHLKLVALAVVLMCVLLIILFNKLLLAKILHYFTDIERHKTAAAFQLSFSIKYALGLVFTTAILTLLVEDVKFHNIYQHEYGVIEEETIMYFFAAFFVPFIWLSNPWYLAKKIKIYFNFNSNKYTQMEANEMMELPEYSIGKRYAEIIEIVWFTYFYASLIPIGAFLTLIGICLFYWVDKYNLLRKSSVKQNISKDVSMKGLIMLDLTLVLKPIGEIVFDAQLRDHWNYESTALMLVGLVYVLVPKDKILDLINGEKFKLNRENFTQIETSRLQAYNQLGDDIYHSRQFPKHPSLVLEEKNRIQQNGTGTVKFFQPKYDNIPSKADLNEQLYPERTQ